MHFLYIVYEPEFNEFDMGGDVQNEHKGQGNLEICR